MLTDTALQTRSSFEQIGVAIRRRLTVIPKQDLQAAKHGQTHSLEYFHSSGICHGDNKLENILLAKNPDVKLCDFGLAVITSGSEGGDSLAGLRRLEGRHTVPQSDKGFRFSVCRCRFHER